MEEEKGIVYVPHISGIFSPLEFDRDVVDVPLKQPRISNLDIFCLIFSIITHLVDMGFDVNIAVRYFLGNKMTYFTWTVCFIFVPSLINVIISRRMQRQDEEINSEFDRPKDSKWAQLILRSKICCLVAIVFQLAPVIHYYDTLIYALKARKCEKEKDYSGQKRFYIKMLQEDQDVALLRVFECFLEAAPQQILQLTILINNYHNINLEFVHQVGSIISSLFSMGWAMTSYNRSIRLAQYDKENFGIGGFICQFLWHFCVTVSRILSITFVASAWPIYASIIYILHWLGMTVWILIDARGILQFCRKHDRAPHVLPTVTERACSILFACVIGVVHVFIYLNVMDGSTLLKHIFFYILCFSENVAATLLWMFTLSLNTRNADYFGALIIPCVLPFLLGILAMVLYYTVFHPTKKSECPSNLSLQPK